MNLPQKIIKRTMDMLIAGFLIVVLFPLLLLVSIVIWLKSGPGVIFKQERVGRNGRVFTMYKFRSMIPNAENMGAGIYFSGPDDPRVTRVGRLLRKTSLDELPQLFNVLKGEMSIVGPRPPLVQQYPCFRESHRKRFAVKPGITGWAQVNGRHTHSWARRIKHDIWYVENYSIWLDLLILLKTVKVVVNGSGIHYATPEEMEDF